MSIDKIVAIDAPDLQFDENGTLITSDDQGDGRDNEENTDSSNSQNIGVDEDNDVSDELPEKFKGKSSGDIAKAYAELERDRSRLANEVGDLRKLTREILERDASNSTPTSDRIEEELSFEDDPEKYIQRAVEKAVQPVQESATKTAYEQRFAKFTSEHPDYLEIGQDSEFAKYVAAAPHRIALYERAQKQDLEAANALLTDFKMFREVTRGDSQQQQETQQQARSRRVRQASPETGATGATTGKIYKSAELIRMQMQDPERYAAEQDEIMRAYAEGRVK